MPPQVLAVIDVGSNSGRVVVLRVTPSGHLGVLADSRAPLRLARDVQRHGRISDPTAQRTAAALRDFRSIADRAGATAVVAVATSAVRESANADEVLARLRSDGGTAVRIIDGDAEARYSLRGAIHGLCATSGLLMDIGGGSLELASFEGRRLVRSWTLPLGALRVSDEHLRADPPTGPQIDGLLRRAAELLTAAGIPQLGRDQRLVGTGGTVRNLAKIDRRTRTYPIPRLHGYVLDREHVRRVAVRLASRTAGRRRSVSGLNKDRADSIVGGAMVAIAVMEHAGATQLLVSGQGLREGLALERARIGQPALDDVREASICALTARFAEWDADRAARRCAVAWKLQQSVWPQADDQLGARLRHAATLLDVGRSIDYYRRHEHTADIVTEADLAGFDHRELALLAALIRTAGDGSARWRLYRPLVARDDKEQLARAGAVLALADAVEQRMPADAPPWVAIEVKGRVVVLDVPIFDPWLRDSLASRFVEAFGQRLVFSRSPAGAGSTG